MNERYELAIERIHAIVNEDTVNDKYRNYFQNVANFILEIHAIKNRLETKPNVDCTLEELKNENENIYKDVLSKNYEMSLQIRLMRLLRWAQRLGRF